MLSFPLTLLNQSGRGWEDRWKRQKQASDARPTLLGDSTRCDGDETSEKQSKQVFKPCGSAEC
jgi:hypothetical protein